MSKRIVIIGGVAGGMSAAARARRLNEQASITVLEAGGFVSFANCGLPYHIAGRIRDENKLLITNPQRLRDRFNIDVHTHTRAVSIDRASKTVLALRDGTSEPVAFPYDVAIIATGAAPIIPPIANADRPNVLTLRSMEDTRRLQGLLQSGEGRNAVIVGAGFIGLEMAEALVDRGYQVLLIEKAERVLPPLDGDIAELIEIEAAARGVRIVTGTGLKSLTESGGRVTAVETEDGRSYPADVVLLSIGVRPNVDLARSAGLILGPTGAIAVDPWQRTSDPAILAVGDATEVVSGTTGQAARVPLGGPANRQGRVAGTVAALGEVPAVGTPAAGAVMGTAIVQVFSLSAGLTGLTEKAARAAGIPFDTAIVTAAHHASYYPGSHPLRLKLVYRPDNGKLLGLQAAGQSGVDKRLDIAATVLHFGGTVADLARLDLAYAPQFGSAKDPLHMAAFIAENQRGGLVRTVRTVPAGSILLDVRTPDEFVAGHLPDAVNIPLESLRQRLIELPKDRDITTYCQIGQRGYVASRILLQRGFTRVANLAGGYTVAARLPLGA
jgi:NADPH-dependent 2,4-dienoyl-CoA reductase/sulfur reductase-like enzyme/rhodanese-related sulfurtransferase